MKDVIFIDDLIKKYELSPLEEIMFLYDNARLLNKESDECNTAFSLALHRYGIRSYMHWRHGIRVGHLLHVIYIKDTKYDVDGVFFFDLDLPMDKNIVDYKYMAKPIDYFAELDKEIGLVDYDISEFSTVTDNFLDIAFSNGYNEIPGEDIDIINRVSEIIDGKSLNLPSTHRNDFFIYDKKNEDIGNRIVTEEDLEYLNSLEPFTYEQLEKIYEKINHYDILLNQKISGETFIKLLFNNLKIKYLEGENVNLSSDYIKNIFYLSEWEFSHDFEKFILTQAFDPEYEEISPLEVAKKLDIDLNDNSNKEVINYDQISCLFYEYAKESFMKNIDIYFDLINLEGQINKVKFDNSKIKTKRNLKIV